MPSPIRPFDRVPQSVAETAKLLFELILMPDLSIDRSRQP
jgi:hypothetical protein